MSGRARQRRRSRRFVVAARSIVAFGLAATCTWFLALKSYDLIWWALAA